LKQHILKILIFTVYRAFADALISVKYGQRANPQSTLACQTDRCNASPLRADKTKIHLNTIPTVLQ